MSKVSCTRCYPSGSLPDQTRSFQDRLGVIALSILAIGATTLFGTAPLLQHLSVGDAGAVVTLTVAGFGLSGLLAWQVFAD